jgi:hypothetical protein
VKDSDERKIPSLQKYTAYISRAVCEEMRYLDREVWQEQMIDDLSQRKIDCLRNQSWQQIPCTWN